MTAPTTELWRVLDDHPAAPGMYLISRAPIVHKVDVGTPGCTNVALARIRKAVTPNQCLVFGLCGCDKCWPGRDEFARLVGLKRQGLRP